jgi:hypothetical protein
VCRYGREAGEPVDEVRPCMMKGWTGGRALHGRNIGHFYCETVKLTVCNKHCEILGGLNIKIQVYVFMIPTRADMSY